MYDYHCNYCDFDFFEEEGYNAELDAIVCSICGVARYPEDDDTFIEEAWL